jgi:endonuclease YncB( thermonuclease family)
MKLFKIFLISLTLLFSPISEAKTYGSSKVSKIISVYDGDTFTIQGDKKWPSIIRDGMKVRIDSIDCPEMKDKRDSVKLLAVKAKQFTSDKLKAAKVVELRDMKRDKYFRILASVYVDGWNLGDSLKVLGLAKGYNGGSKTW